MWTAVSTMVWTMTDFGDEDTAPTEEDGLIDQLRRDGVLGPFLVVDWFAASDDGRVRSRNEDRWHVAGDEVFALADGMGGHPGGDLAADVAARVAGEYGHGLVETDAADFVHRVNDAVAAAGRERGLTELGTTLVTMVAHRNHVVALSVGDSRIYRFRDAELEQLTTDHTVRNELVAAGVPLERASGTSLKLSALTSHIGARATKPIQTDVASFALMSGDRFLLCSDGVHGQVDPSQIAAALGRQTCREAADQLVATASEAGGRDNATAVVVEFASAERGAP